MKKRAMVVEFGASHYEVLPTHFQILERAGYEVFAFVNAAIADKVPGGVPKETFTFRDEDGTFATSWKLLRLCRKLGIRRMILNSANGNRVRTLTLLALFFPSLRVVGVNHYVSKFQGSMTQWLISMKVKRYFVLSDLFFENGVLRRDEHGLRIRSLYPVAFSEAEPIDKEGRILLVIPGVVLEDRRDYSGFLDVLASEPPPERLWFALLGDSSTPDGRRFRARVEQLGLSRWLWMHDGFVDQETYGRFLQSADLVFPLIHLDDPRYREFVENKVSGSYAAGLGLRIPFLMHEGFRAFSDFRDVSIFYERGSLGAALKRIAADPSEIEKLRAAYEGNEKLTLESRTRGYMDLLEG